MIMNELKQAIRQYELKAGITTCELAEELGLHFATLYRILSGTRNPGVRVLRALATIPELRQAVNDFIGDKQKSLWQRQNGKLGRFRGWLRELLGRGRGSV